MSVKSGGTATLDGGPFRCGNHGDKEFVTTDPDKWFAHIAQESDHVMSGKKPCSMCGKMHEFTEEPAGNAVYCDNCKKKLTKVFAGASKTESKSKK